MTENAIMARRQSGGDGGGAKIGREFLERYAHDLNCREFSRLAGWQWFVNVKEVADPLGGTKRQHFLDRKDVPKGTPKWLAQQAADALKP